MEDLNNFAFQSLDRYFKVLEKTGYISDTDVNKVLLTSFIQEFIEEFEGYITEEDYNLINKILVCLSGTSCLISYMQYKQMSTPLQGYIYTTPFRITQSDISRKVQTDEGLRLVNQ